MVEQPWFLTGQYTTPQAIIIHILSQAGLPQKYIYNTSLTVASLYITHSPKIHYCILLSKRPSPCKCPPPLFDDPMVHVYMRYAYKWLVRVSPHPRFWPVNFKRPWALTQENMVVDIYSRCSHITMDLKDFKGVASLSSGRSHLP